MKKKKVLIITTGLYKSTGYATVARNIYKLIKDKFEVGFLYTVADEYPQKDLTTFIIPKPKDAYKVFAHALQKFKPDVVITIGDVWRLEFVYQVKQNYSFKWLGYVAVEGKCFPKKLRTETGTYIDIPKIMSYIDTIVAYSEFGQNELITAGYDVENFIYHGVDTEIFKPVYQDGLKLKKEYFNVDGNPFLYFCVADNQPRKRLDLLLKAWAELKKRNNNNDILFLLTQPDKFNGFNLLELLKRYNIGDSVFLHPEYIHARGLSQSYLVNMYNLSNAFVLCSVAEGFGLPYLEALACGVPVVYTDYATPKEILKDIGYPVKPESYAPMYDLLFEKAELNVMDIVEQLEKVKDFRDNAKLVSYAKKFDWKNFKGAWINAINKTIAKPSKIGVIV